MDIFGVGGQRFQSSEMRLLLSYFVYIANDVSFFQSAYDSGLIIPATRQLPDCLILAMFSGVSSVLCPLSGAASLSCQEGLLYCSARHGLCCFMAFQSESMIEISICFRRELTAGLALRSVTRSLKRIDLSTHGWKGSWMLFQHAVILWNCLYLYLSPDAEEWAARLRFMVRMPSYLLY